MSYKKDVDESREDIYKAFQDDLWNDERIVSDRTLGRMVDASAIEKCRLSRYGQQSKTISRFTQRTGDYDDMQKARDQGYRPADKGYDARDFDLDQNIAMLFYNAYGEGFYGEPYPSKDDEYICKGCRIKMKMSLKAMPERCPRCNRETPLGQLYKDRILKRA